MSRLGDEVERLRDGRDLNVFDLEVVEIVAGLVLRARDAREAVEREEAIIDDGKGFPIEHPALAVEKRASMELRGWVKDRPDLFGARGVGEPVKQEESSVSPRDRFGGFKIV